ncbi:hypothetical protein QJQ45_019675 [Haematococcus lacustris]|nr:hypothetical protein QJQ45_019675 [Haematococcus lacustris]
MVKLYIPGRVLWMVYEDRQVIEQQQQQQQQEQQQQQQQRAASSSSSSSSSSTTHGTRGSGLDLSSPLLNRTSTTTSMGPSSSKRPVHMASQCPNPTSISGGCSSAAPEPSLAQRLTQGLLQLRAGVESALTGRPPGVNCVPLLSPLPPTALQGGHAAAGVGQRLGARSSSGCSDQQVTGAAGAAVIGAGAEAGARKGAGYSSHSWSGSGVKAGGAGMGWFAGSSAEQVTASPRGLRTMSVTLDNACQTIGSGLGQARALHPGGQAERCQTLPSGGAQDPDPDSIAQPPRQQQAMFGAAECNERPMKESQTAQQPGSKAKRRVGCAPARGQRPVAQEARCSGRCVVLLEADRTQFEQLSLVTSCASDHIPDTYYTALQQLYAASLPARQGSEQAADEGGCTNDSDAVNWVGGHATDLDAICVGFTLLFSMAKKKRRTVPRLVPEDPDSDIEDRDEALQPDLTEAQQNRKASGEARAARDRDNTYHGRKCKIAHLIDHLPQELWDAFLDDAVQPRVEAISERAVLASLLFGLLVRGLFTIHVADPLGLHDQPVYTDIPVSQAAIPDLSCRNLFLQLVRGLPGNGANTRPNAAVAAVLAAHPDLRARLAAIPRHPSDTNMVDHVGKQLETAFSNMLTLLFAGRLKKSVSLAGAKVLLGTEEHRRRFGFWGLGGGHLPAWSKRQCTYVRRMVCGLDVSWLVGEGGVVPTAAMQAEVALQRGLLGLEEGEGWMMTGWKIQQTGAGCCAMRCTPPERWRQPWQPGSWTWCPGSRLSSPTQGCCLGPPAPPHPMPSPPPASAVLGMSSSDTRGLYGMMRDAGMLGVLTEEGVTSLAKFRNGALPDPARPGHYIEGPKDSHVANRWDALLPDPRRQKLASPKHSFAQIVHTDGVAISVMFLRPKPAAPPADPPRMGKHMGAVNPLAHLDAEWLGVDPGKTNMATVAHEERSAAGTVVSVRHWKLTAGQYYRDSGITRQTQATKTWLAKVEPQLTALSRVSSKPSSLASYRQFADTVLATYDAMWAEVSKPRWANAKFRLYCGKMRVVASFWAKVKKQAQKRWPDRILALAYGAAGFSGSGSIGCRGVPVSQMRKEAVKQFGAGRVVLVEEFRTSRVSSAYSSPSEALPGQPPESFRWLRPVYSEAKRSQVRGLMCSTSNNIRFYDRDVSAALNIRRCAVGPGPRPTELCYWDGRPAMPKPGQARPGVGVPA